MSLTVSVMSFKSGTAFEIRGDDWLDTLWRFGSRLERMGRMPRPAPCAEVALLLEAELPDGIEDGDIPAWILEYLA